MHHGNGTQDLFDKDPHLFYASTHMGFGQYPGAARQRSMHQIWGHFYAWVLYVYVVFEILPARAMVLIHHHHHHNPRHGLRGRDGRGRQHCKCALERRGRLQALPTCTFECTYIPPHSHFAYLNPNSQPNTYPIRPNAPITPTHDTTQAYESRILPALRRFKPELLLVSTGFDAHGDDPLGELELTPEDFHWVTARCVGLGFGGMDGNGDVCVYHDRLTWLTITPPTLMYTQTGGGGPGVRGAGRGVGARGRL